PYHGEIGHLYERTAHRDARSLRHWKVLNDTVNFRKDRERFFRLSCLFKLRDLFVSDVPEPEPPFRRFDQPLEISARRVRVLRRAVARTQQIDQFALRG